MNPMMMQDKKAASVVEDDMDGLMLASEEIMAALESKEPKRLKIALKAFIEMCDYAEDEESQDY
jgi:hypothetical protein